MPAALNHTIVHVRDAAASATFLAQILGLPAPRRIVARGVEYFADPAASRKGEINRNDGGRGVYFRDPSGHYLEIITRPYGSGGA
jgi:catechol 2,3-dioxygenase-like lactoylglutathione lyase family enzyme